MIHMETVRLTASQALVRFLENQYISYIDMDGNEQEHKFVKGIFMLPGHGNVVGFANGVEQELKDMVVYQGKNEQGMALAAVGYAKQMRRKSIFACTSSVGPGACNMVTAAATATANNIPVLILPGDIYASRQPDPVLQQMEQPQNLSISAHDAFQAVTKYWGRINRPEQVMTDMISAMRVLTDTANTGAVAISLPQDVQAEAYDYPVDFFKKRVWRIDRRPVTKYALDKAVEVIKNAKKPLLICGGGVRYAEAHKVFKKFAEDFKDDKMIYFMASGASEKMAYSHAAFLFTEMQWIDAAAYNTGEYFHGPFEVSTEGKPYVFFMSDGATRPMDARALTFLERMGAKVALIDSKDYGLADAVPASVVTYFNPLLHLAVMREYGNQIAEARQHPLTMRRYMWKLSY